MAQMSAILLDPVSGLLLWVIVSPYAPFIHLDIRLGAGIPDLGLDRVAAGFFCMVMLAQVAQGRRRLAPFTKVDAALLAFSLTLALSARKSLQGPFSALQLMFDSYFIPFLVYFLAKNLIRDREAMRRAFVALSIIAGYLVFLAIYEQVTGNELFVTSGRVDVYGGHLRRVNSLLQNPAYIALALNMVLPFLLWAAFRVRDTAARWGYGLACVLVVGTTVSLYNRAGWLSALLVLLLSVGFYPRLRRWLLLALVAIGLALALSWKSLSSSALFSERLAYGPSINYRVRAMEAVLHMVARQPLFGIGFNNFPVLSLAEGWITRRTLNWWLPTPHNSYLDVLLATGAVGLSLFLTVFATLAWEGWRLYRWARHDPVVDRGLIVVLWSVLLVFTVSIATFDIVAAPFCAMLFCLIAGAILGSQSWPTLWAPRRQELEE